ncbi:hypothetical protein CVT26_005799 [Gymnopilus dilepis]|uniref:Uncharacterized protein n=1 Tax=Gymnopilus dilepis TaxID=231916 RepID=A0A409YMD2_9AGAR|nr:hypothetical protein CVT26_005799 [Gymnopilus dilepis]
MTSTDLSSFQPYSEIFRTWTPASSLARHPRGSSYKTNASPQDHPLHSPKLTLSSNLDVTSVAHPLCSDHASHLSTKYEARTPSQTRTPGSRRHWTGGAHAPYDVFCGNKMENSRGRHFVSECLPCPTAFYDVLWTSNHIHSPSVAVNGGARGDFVVATTLLRKSNEIAHNLAAGEVLALPELWDTRQHYGCSSCGKGWEAIEHRPPPPPILLQPPSPMSLDLKTTAMTTRTACGQLGFGEGVIRTVRHPAARWVYGAPLRSQEMGSCQAPAAITTTSLGLKATAAMMGRAWECAERLTRYSILRYWYKAHLYPRRLHPTCEAQQTTPSSPSSSPEQALQQGRGQATLMSSR